MIEITQIRRLSLWIFFTPLIAINLCLIISQNPEFLDNTCYRKLYNLINNLFCCICNYTKEREKNRIKRKQLNFAIDLTKEVLNEINMENSKNILTQQDIINIKNASYIFAKNNNIGIENDYVLHPSKRICSKKVEFINKIKQKWTNNELEGFA